MNMKLPRYLLDGDDADGGQEDQVVGPFVDVSVDFSEYMWMADEEQLEDFDRQVEEEFWEEAFLEACFEEMLEEEEMHFNNLLSETDDPVNKPSSSSRPSSGSSPSSNKPVASCCPASSSSPQRICSSYSPYKAQSSKSRLNPEAPEFYPNWSFKADS